MKQRLFILILCSGFACGGERVNAPDKSMRASAKQSEGMLMGLTICDCYMELAKTMRRSRLNVEGADYPEARKAVEQQKDSLARQASICFQQMRSRHDLASRKDSLSAAEKAQIEEDIAKTLDSECPQVAKLLEEGY